MSKTPFGLFVAAIMLIAIACGSSDSDGELTSVSLALDWFPNSNHAGIFEAIDRGYFVEEGLDVNVYTPSDPSTVLQTVGAGRDDFGISYQPELLQARSAGVPVVSVMGIVQHPLNSIMTLGESGLESPGDLKGQRIGHTNNPSNQAMLATMLAEEGLTIDDVELVDVGFNLVPALLGGTVDAIIGAYWTHESILIEQEGKEVNIMRMEEWGLPDFYELILAASENTVAERPDVVEGFVRAMRRGFEVAEKNPQASVDTLLKANPDTVNEPLERKGVDLLQPLWGGGVPKIGWQDASRWESFTAWMKAGGFIEANVDASASFTNEFVAK
ncbi:MAG: ABC transporter substrate-binding protein [Chloroflexi bacterium]|nr:ABC transporter substrate-binding protein [Chloroflexota bacterium]